MPELRPPRRSPPPLVLAATLAIATAGAAMPPPAYPPARTVDGTDDYHGTRVADPYRWLEDADAPETAAWVAAENAVTSAWLGAIPARERLRQRLTELWDYARFDAPFREGGRYFFTRNDGLQPQAVLYVQAALDAEPRVLLDPNTLSPDGTVALSGLSVSRDGRLLAWSASESGSDWQVWRVRDIATGRDLDDRIEWAKFTGAAWSPDNAGFYYARYAPPRPDGALAETNYCQKLYYHRLGTPQARDTLVYARPDRPEWLYGATVSEDGRYLVLTIGEGTDRRNRVYYRDLAAPDGSLTPLLDDFDAGYTFLGNDGARFYFRTDCDAPRGRIVAVELAAPARADWRVIVPEERDPLQSAIMLNDQFLTVSLQDARHVVRRFARDGRPLGGIALPGPGSVGGFSGHRTDRETFFSFTSFLDPTRIYHLDLATGRSALFRAPDFAFDFDRYETRQVFYTSRDGTRVPMFLVHRRGLKLDGSNPTYLYGYGGFNASLTPAFSPARLAWLELGGVYAQANLRGGGEYGEAWHQAGMLDRKQNVFDDFIAAAEWLIANRYTSTPKLAIGGGSNGGLLVGACLNQRPDLFGAAVPAVGVMDMLRFHRFTIGWAWVTDYGCATDPTQFPALYAYSPYHNIRPGVCYPPTLITTADHDDRVVPGHSFKYAARLQAAQGCANPILIRIETQAGHGAGKPTAKLIEETADTWAFLVRALGVE
ncbi:MAG: prolyl oligopeptidase family serine peptidase [Candidatus Krumholzibacteriia bacterium]